MTSSLSHNVDGAPLSRNGGADEKDGAGVPIASTLKSIVDGKWGPGYWKALGKGLWLQPSSFDANNYFDPGSDFRFVLQSGESVRSVLSWMYCSQNNTTFLAADMDLHLINEDWGVVVDSSSSWTNNNEMLEYKNTSAPHWYRLKIKKYGTWLACNGTQFEYAGLVFAIHNQNFF